MRIRKLTGCGCLDLRDLVYAGSCQATAADRVVVLKKERTSQLLSHGKVIKSHLDGCIAVTNEEIDEIWARHAD